MMIIHLVKKDILLVKKYVLPTLLIAIGIPLFIAFRVPRIASTMGFMLTVIFSEIMFGQYIAIKEDKYAKASALLCSAPYSKGSLVLAKYITFVIVFIYCTLVYWIETLFISVFGGINLTVILWALLVASVAYGIYIPIQYKFGYEKTKYYTTIILMSSSFVLPFIVVNSGAYFRFLSSIPVAIANLGIFLFCVIFILLSMMVSIKIFKDKELV